MKHFITIILMLCIAIASNAQVAGGQISRQKSQQTTKKNTQGTAKKQTQRTTPITAPETRRF